MARLVVFALCEEHTKLFLIILCLAGPKWLKVTYCLECEKSKFAAMKLVVMILDLLAKFSNIISCMPFWDVDISQKLL
jgi:hypothetical protein